MIIVPNDGDSDEVESELRRLSCDEREREAETRESDWESEGPKGFASGLFNQNAPNDAVLGEKKEKEKKKGRNDAILS